MFEFLDKELDLDIKRVPEKYFSFDEGIIKYANFYKYKMASQAEKFFKSKVLELDSEGLYTNEKVKSVVDLKATKEKQGKYANTYKMIDDEWLNYMDEHPDEFNEIEMVDSFDGDIALGFAPQIKLTLEEAWQGYLTASALKKLYGSGGELNDLMPKVITRRSKKEFADKHRNLKSMQYINLGVPEPKTLEVRTQETVKGIKGGRGSYRTITNPEILQTYSEEFTEYLKHL